MLADETRLKEQAYLGFVNAISIIVLSDDLEKSREIFAVEHNRILLIGSAEVVRNLRNFSQYISLDRSEPFSSQEHDRLLTELIKSMRLDLHKDKKTNMEYPLIALNGKGPRIE